LSEFIGFLQELFEKWGQVTARSMFGGQSGQASSALAGHDVPQQRARFADLS